MNDEIRIPGEAVSPDRPDIVWDLNGFPINRKYPPQDLSRRGLYEGYTSANRLTLFYDFAVQDYDLRFSYKGVWYYVVVCMGYVALCDSKFNEEYARFANANTFLETFKIDGVALIDLVDELENVEPM